ncbi:MAG: parvulin peptidyl-prolyl isomerase [Ignavibacteriales bacterium]|nr:parvulin peptidyl-prolyl isomerase [Ignavibacteriales bacterium]
MKNAQLKLGNRATLAVAFAFLTLVGAARAQQVVEQIVAVVDDEIVLQSELEIRAAQLAAQLGVEPTDEHRRAALETLVEEKLALAQAKYDSVEVNEEEVKAQVDAQLDMYARQFGSLERLEQVYGMSIDKLKREMRETVRNSMLVQRLRQEKFGFIEATRRETLEFYEEYKDSLDPVPERVAISHLFLNPEMTDELKAKYRRKAEAIRDSILAGASFEEMAKKYSEDPASAKFGGDLGFAKRGQLFTEYEAAAFALDSGEISPVVESPAGFHVIQLIERRGDAVRTRHVLVKAEADDDADLVAIERLNAIRDSVVSGETTFEEMAKKYSDDAETAPFGGELGVFYLHQLEKDEKLLEAVEKLDEGEISYPRRTQTGGGDYGYHIVYLRKRTPQHQFDPETDYEDLNELATGLKRQKRYEEWIAELKEKIYWDVKIEGLL